MTGPEDLANAERAFLLAPAGCGKTELIAAAIASSASGRQLVLTHTHAGVGALRARLLRFGVPPRSFHVDTIAGFALRYASGYPATSGLTELQPTGGGWAAVYGAAQRVLTGRIGLEVLRASYDGIYVDEYQDCTADQHAVILALAEARPCRVLGDPLQGIFGFAGKLVDWDDDVAPEFEELPSLSTPWRWVTSNPALGEWLLGIREALSARQPLDLTGAPIALDESTPNKQVAACHRAAVAGGSVVGIRKWAHDAHGVARKLGGRFTSMEEMDCNDLLKYCERLETTTGPARAEVVVDFAIECMTAVSTALAVTRKKLAAGETPRPKDGTKITSAVIALSEVASSTDPRAISRALAALAAIDGAKVYRRELLSEMRRTATAVAEGSFESLPEAAWAIRDRARHTLRTLDAKLISRTLLVKGLEFDRCIVLDASELDARNLYVALTRGSTSLTVLTKGGSSTVLYSGVKQ
ncbi:MAG: UvrD-helicase domain-containing protein [Acidimicrobiales bacterium]